LQDLGIYHPTPKLLPRLYELHEFYSTKLLPVCIALTGFQGYSQLFGSFCKIFILYFLRPKANEEVEQHFCRNVLWCLEFINGLAHNVQGFMQVGNVLPSSPATDAE
jgi:hypothetical protein